MVHWQGPALGLMYLALGGGSFVIMVLTLRLLSYGREQREQADSGDGARTAWNAPERLEIVEIIEESPDVKSFCMKRQSGKMFPRYLGGQFLSFEIAGAEKCLRSYSLSSSVVAQCWTIQISVKKIAGGRGSTWFHQRQVGETVVAYPPSGHFVDKLPPEVPRIYVAGGIGITPFVSMIASHYATPTRADITLFFGARTSKDLIYHHYFQHLASRRSTFHYSPILSRSQDHEDVDIARGHITCDFMRRQVEAANPGEAKTWQRASFFFCGPSAMTEGLMQELASQGVSEERMFCEAFVSPTMLNPQTLPAVQAQVSFRGHSYDYQGPQDVLSFLEDQNQQIPYACRVGVCGSCRVKITGPITMLTDSGLTRGQKQEGYALSCVSYPQGDVSVSL